MTCWLIFSFAKHFLENPILYCVQIVCEEMAFLPDQTLPFNLNLYPPPSFTHEIAICYPFNSGLKIPGLGSAPSRKVRSMSNIRVILSALMRTRPWN